MKKLTRYLRNHIHAYFLLTTFAGLFCVLLTGCTTTLMQVLEYTATEQVSIRKKPNNPLEGPLQLLSYSGPQKTGRTEQILRKHNLGGKSETEAIEQLQTVLWEKPNPDLLYAVIELNYLLASKEKISGKKAEAFEHYGVTTAMAYWFMFDPQYQTVRNTYDPQFRRVCDFYNNSLEQLLRLSKENKSFVPGTELAFMAGGYQIKVALELNGPWQAADFSSFEFCSDYELTGIQNQNHTFGLGVPIIAQRGKGQAVIAPYEKYYPPGLTFPLTAFLRVSETDTSTTTPTIRCKLEFHDPTTSLYTNVGGEEVPLESDLSIPLAYYLNNPLLKSRYLAFYGFLNPTAGEQFTGLYMLEPYDPEKIPVVMVHGLWSSPITWTEMFNDLRSNPEISKNYQFWFYMYPTGQPFWISATQMRDDLAQARLDVDPTHVNSALDQMVLVGHSMGGLVSKMQMLESEDEFWKIVSEEPVENLKATPELFSKIQKVLFFHPNPSIKRIVTIATPHRGSNFANDATRYLARTFVTLPSKIIKPGQDIIEDNPNYFKNTDLLTITTSIDSLSPDSPVLPTMLKARKAPWTRHHNIAGNIEFHGIWKYLYGPGDGIVSVESAKLDDVASHIEVEAEHTDVHKHPRAILEVERILLEHLKTLKVAQNTSFGIHENGQTKTSGGSFVETYKPMKNHYQRPQRLHQRPFQLNPTLNTHNGSSTRLSDHQ
ncbi:MAG: hypothetical protein MPJ24_08440 [Pirellulaceae bacterium]|nr:hypothetical protein [Pirellulaceae bacterium]